MQKLLIFVLAICSLCSVRAEGLDDGVAAYQRKDYGQAFEIFKALAIQGDPRAQTNLAELYKKGQGTPQSFAEAAKWYALAADQGFSNAQFSLGALYANGQGVKTDNAEAVRLFGLAAVQGHAQAQLYVAEWARKGYGVPQNYAVAAKWYTLAAEQGNENAQFNLGVLYQRGDGVQQDYAQSVKWCKRAADQNYPPAQSCTGQHYENGWGVLKDETEATKWYLLAAKQGFAAAQFHLGTLLAVKKSDSSYSEAMKWLKLAAVQGDANAQFNLGAMYLKGLPQPQGTGAGDLVRAHMWFRLAGASGFVGTEQTTQLLRADHSDGYSFSSNGVTYHVKELVEAKNLPTSVQFARKRPDSAGADTRDMAVKQVTPVGLVARQMTKQQIQESMELERTCKLSNFKTCD